MKIKFNFNPLFALIPALLFLSYNDEPFPVVVVYLLTLACLQLHDIWSDLK